MGCQIVPYAEQLLKYSQMRVLWILPTCESSEEEQVEALVRHYSPETYVEWLTSLEELEDDEDDLVEDDDEEEEEDDDQPFLNVVLSSE